MRKPRRVVTPILAATTCTLALIAGAMPATAVAPAAADAVRATSSQAQSDGTIVRSDSSREVFILAANAPVSPRGAHSTPADAAASFVAQSALRPRAAGHDASVTSVSRSALGGSVVRLDRTIDGVPLLGGDIAVDLTSDGRVRAASGMDTLDASVDTSTTVTPGEAARIAVRTTASERGIDPDQLTAGDPTLWIYDPRLIGAPGVPQARPVWHVVVTSSLRPDVRHLVLVDARRGSTALAVDLITHARERLTCDAAMTDGRSPCTAPLDVAAGERGESDPVSAIEDVNFAHDYTGDSYDFFLRYFDRDSIDDSGMPLLSTVRFRPPDAPDTNYRNAFWNGVQMTYGEGMVAQDVVGHELMHGVTEHRSPLFYYTQSGAINESLSDIFGEFIDLLYPGGNDDSEVRWQMGEDIAPIFGYTLRSMKEPTLSQHPDRTGSPFFRVTDDDRGGVHRNSGVSNKFAYLLTDGDTFNGQVVRGIGIEKTAHIVYGSMALLTSAADFQMLANALRASCATIVGTQGITSDDCAQVNAAILATEMDIEPHNGRVAPAPVCGVDATDRARSATPRSLWSDGFEDDSLAWDRTVALTDGPPEDGSLWYRTGEPIIADWAMDSYAVEGTRNMGIVPPGYRFDSSLSMQSAVTIPRGQVYLRFAHAFEFQREAGGRWDGGVLEYSIDGGGWQDAGPLITDNGYTGALSGVGSDNPLKGRGAFVESSHGYVTTRADLSSLGGHDVRFRFRFATNSKVESFGWFIDDVRVYACPGTPTITRLTPFRRSVDVRASLAATPASPVTGVEYRIGNGSWRGTGGTSGRFTISGLRPNRTYHVQVRALSGDGKSAASAVTSVRTLP